MSIPVRSVTAQAKRRKRRRALAQILFSVAAMVAANAVGQVLAACPLLLLPCLVVAGLCLAVDEHPWRPA